MRVSQYWDVMTSSNGNISALLAICAGNFTGHRWIPRTKASDASFYVFFDLRLNRRLSKQRWGRWFETPPHPLWRHCSGDWVIRQLLDMRTSVDIVYTPQRIANVCIHNAEKIKKNNGTQETGLVTTTPALAIGVTSSFRQTNVASVCWRNWYLVFGHDCDTTYS